MVEKADGIRRNRGGAGDLDAIDRRILGVLVEDATRSYADLGTAVGLSAPAAHERVKRLRRLGAITGTVALIEPKSVGKSLLAFVHVDTVGWGKTPEFMTISAFPEVEEIHSVAGDACLLLKVRARDAQGLEGFLGRLYALPGVKATRSYVVLSTYLERPVQPQITEYWPLPSGGERPTLERRSAARPA